VKALRKRKPAVQPIIVGESMLRPIALRPLSSFVQKQVVEFDEFCTIF
jgi:hypothetical protein